MEIDLKRIAQLGIVLAIALASAAVYCRGQASKTPADPRQAAFALEQQGNNAEAEAVWRAVLKLHPADAEAYAHLGLLEARQERYTEAVPFYRKALVLNPAMPGLRLNLGLSLFKSGALKEAIQTFSPLLKAQPSSSPEALRLTTLIGMAYYGLHEYAAAVTYLREATARDPQNLPYRMALAHSCLWSKQYSCVLDVYREILTLNAESAEADMLAGEAFDELHNDQDALLQFRAAVKADPREPNVHFGLGYLLWKRQQYDEAIQEFHAELANNPDNSQALACLADAEMQSGHPEAAPPLFEEALRIDPGIELAHLDLGILYGDADRKDDALRELKIAEKLNPDDANVHWRLARLYLAAGKKDEANAEFDRTRNLKKSAEATIFNKLHQAQDKGKPTPDALDAKPQN
jgi:tetratricopeptide (TPR) repeat protein